MRPGRRVRIPRAKRSPAEAWVQHRNTYAMRDPATSEVMGMGAFERFFRVRPFRYGGRAEPGSMRREYQAVVESVIAAIGRAP